MVIGCGRLCSSFPVVSTFSQAHASSYNSKFGNNVLIYNGNFLADYNEVCLIGSEVDIASSTLPGIAFQNDSVG